MVSGEDGAVSEIAVGRRRDFGVDIAATTVVDLADAHRKFGRFDDKLSPSPTSLGENWRCGTPQTTRHRTVDDETTTSLLRSPLVYSTLPWTSSIPRSPTSINSPCPRSPVASNLVLYMLADHGSVDIKRNRIF